MWFYVQEQGHQQNKQRKRRTAARASLRAHRIQPHTDVRRWKRENGKKRKSRKEDVKKRLHSTRVSSARRPKMCKYDKKRLGTVCRNKRYNTRSCFLFLSFCFVRSPPGSPKWSARFLCVRASSRLFFLFFLPRSPISRDCHGARNRQKTRINPLSGTAA